MPSKSHPPATGLQMMRWTPTLRNAALARRVVVVEVESVCSFSQEGWVSRLGCDGAPTNLQLDSVAP